MSQEQKSWIQSNEHHVQGMKTVVEVCKEEAEENECRVIKAGKELSVVDEERNIWFAKRWVGAQAMEHSWK